MSDISLKDIEELRKMVQWKNEKPEEYKQFLEDIQEIMIDLMKVSYELAKKIDEY